MPRVFVSNFTRVTVRAKVIAVPSPDWTVPGLFAFDAELGNTANLNDLLPTGAVLGGTFGLSLDSVALPAGVTLNVSTGVLTVTPDAPDADMNGVQFEYIEPV